MFHRSVLIVIAILLALTLSNRAGAATRIALVIGNGAYPNIGELANPSNDARLMADTLRQLGFEVIEKINVSQKPMKKAIKAFGNRLNRAGKDAVGLFYYAGHGVQVNGENYLIPVNVEIIDEADVDIEAVGMRAILQNMEYAGNEMNIIVMDACRNNPFKRGFRSASRGLARMDASKGTLIAYATAPGDVALDGKGQNSPYTEALTANMLKPGVTVERMFKDVRNAVVETTNSAQIPWESSSLTGGDFFFHPAEVIAATPPSTETNDKDFELLFWKSVQNSDSPAVYEAYLSQYPNGVFAALAKVKIDQLTSTADVVEPETPNNEQPEPRVTPAAVASVSVPVPVPVSVSVPASVSGKYIDNSGNKITLKQNGNEIKGKYGVDGVLIGTIEDNTIEFKFYSESGKFHAALSHINNIYTHGKGELKVVDDGFRLVGEAAGKRWELISSVDNSSIEKPVVSNIDQTPGQGIVMFTKEETIALISGKTAVWENYNGVYYAPDGKLFTIWDGEKETGKWEVTDEGAVCWLVPSWGSEPCESYYMGPAGLMAIYKGKESSASVHREGNRLNSL